MKSHWDDEELYSYGLRQLKMSILNIVTIILLGMLFGLLKEGIIFSVCYILLRKTAGGYHAKTPKLCFLYSVLLYIAALVFIRFVPASLSALVVEVVVFFILIKYFPIESENKILSENEKLIYKRIAIVLYVLSFLCSGLLFLLKNDTCYLAVLAAVGATYCLAIVKVCIGWNK